MRCWERTGCRALTFVAAGAIAVALASCGTANVGSGSSAPPSDAGAGADAGAPDAGGGGQPDAGGGGQADAGSGGGGQPDAGGGGQPDAGGGGGSADGGAPGPTRYTLHEVAIPGMQVTVKGLNNEANVVGEYTPPTIGDDGEHGRGFLWDGPSGGWRDLGPSDRYSIAVGVNNRFDIALGVFSPNPPGTTNREHAWLLKDGQSRDLGALPSIDPTTIPWAINASAAIVGGSLASSNGLHAFLADGSGIHDLGAVDGQYSLARAINDAGIASGESSVGNGVHAARFDSNGPHDLGTIGGDYSGAFGINSAGVIVGFATPPGQGGYYPRFGFVVDPSNGGAMRPVGPIPGFTSSSLSAINDAGLAVGFSTSQDMRRNHVLLYDTRSGEIVDLNDRIDDPGWELWYAIAINARGQILGYGKRLDKGILVPFLATPK
jgi:uncharacterized membrane protein